jgi:thiol-disulfide isomerase/thioredoxin
LAAALLGAAVFVFLRQSGRTSVEVPINGQAAPGFPLDEPFAVWQGRGRGFGKKKTLRELFPAVAPGVIVNFWATWCPPCIEEFPSMTNLGNQLEQASDARTRLVAIAVDEEMAAVTRFLDALPYDVRIPVLFDPGGRFAATLGTTKFPETYWVTREGTVPMRWVGPQEWLGADVLTTLRTLTEQ